MTADGLIVSARNALAVVTIDRPGARNALTAAMRTSLAEAVQKWARDPLIYAMVVQSAAPEVFSPGRDVRELSLLRDADPAAARRALASEFMLVWLLECFSKPTVSLIDGIVMGAGAGISTYATHRVAGEAYRFAMPETGLGFFPDDGFAHVFARLPDAIGMYLGLTGRAIGRADAFRLGIATHCVPAARFEEIRAGLADAVPVDPLLEALHVHPGAADIDTWAKVIARCFSAGSVGEIRQRLAEETGAAGRWAGAVLEDLDRRAPLSLAVTHRHIHEAAARDLRQTLMIDYRLACGFLDGHDFHEGVQAALIDKGHAPRWQPARLADVTPGMLERLFQPSPGAELNLPTRQEMQAARV